MNRRSPCASTDRFLSAPAFLAAFALVSLFATGPALAATRIAHQDFESANWANQFTGQNTWGDHITRTTHDPYAGSSYCLRWNQNDNRVDPITGLQGTGLTGLLWGGGTDIVSQTPNGVFFRMAFRHDDYNNPREWGGPRKLGYIIDDYFSNHEGQGGYLAYSGLYIAGQFGPYDLRMSGNDGLNDSWCRANWGYDSCVMSNPAVSPGLNGDWVDFAFYIDFNENTIQMWIDGNILYPQEPVYNQLYPELAAEGKLLLPPHPLTDAWRVKSFNVAYYDHTRDCPNCSDQTGFHSGFQIDDLEYWDGIPGDEGDVDNPPGILISTPVPGGDDYHIPDSVGTLVITGSANDDHGIAEITWSNDLTSESGQISGQSGNWTNWQLQGILLETGVNTISIRVRDSSNQITTETITVTRDWEYPGKPETPEIP